MPRQVPDNYFVIDPFTNTAPVAPTTPWLRWQVGSDAIRGTPTTPVLGVIVLAAIVLVFEHFRRKGGRR